MKNKKIISLQLDEELLSKIQFQAEKNFRSLSAQIRFILEEYLRCKFSDN